MHVAWSYAPFVQVSGSVGGGSGGHGSGPWGACSCPLGGTRRAAAAHRESLKSRRALNSRRLCRTSPEKSRHDASGYRRPWGDQDATQGGGRHDMEIPTEQGTAERREREARAHDPESARRRGARHRCAA